MYPSSEKDTLPFGEQSFPNVQGSAPLNIEEDLPMKVESGLGIWKYLQKAAYVPENSFRQPPKYLLADFFLHPMMDGQWQWRNRPMTEVGIRVRILRNTEKFKGAAERFILTCQNNKLSKI
jgi:hypothetical protein